jgi:hypothetical protein
LLLFDLLDWPLDGNPSVFSKANYATNAVLGGVMIGWGILMFLLVNGPLAQGDQAIRRYLMIGLLSWFTFDSTGSFFAELPGNILLNVSFLLLFLPPLILLKKNH